MNTPTMPTPRPADDAPDQPTVTVTDTGSPVGEGSYEGTQRYAEGIEHYLETADVAKDAADAAPDSAQEAAELDDAEAAAASRTRAPGK
jgi:hypothetical protein